MPNGISTFVENGFATISVEDSKLRGQTLQKILKHTPPEFVQTNTRTGSHRTHTIPEGNAREAGLIDGEGDAADPGDRWDSGNAASLTQAYAQEKADDHHIVTPTVAEDAYVALGQRELYGTTVDGPPVDANGRVTGPLRPNKRVADPDEMIDEVTARYERGGMSTPAAMLQQKIRDARPVTPADTAPDKNVPVDDRTPSGTLTLHPELERTEVPESHVVEVRAEDPPAPAPAPAPAKKAPAKKAPAKKAPAKPAAKKDDAS